ncbi:MAG: RNA polymerase sigma factor [Planctomycetota bacterium]
MESPFADLLARARGGDREALETLLTPQLPALTAYVRLRLEGALARRESSADLVQSICREVIDDIATVKGATEEAFRGWLYGIAAHKLSDRRDYHRAARRDPARESPAPPETSPEELLLAYSRIATPSREAMSREELDRIEAAFDALPPDHRDVLVHVAIAGLSYAETSALTGRSEVSLRQLVHRARARLATLLA